VHLFTIHLRDFGLHFFRFEVGLPQNTISIQLKLLQLFKALGGYAFQEKMGSFVVSAVQSTFQNGLLKMVPSLYQRFNMANFL